MIRCSRGSAAEMIARTVDALLRDHILNSRANDAWKDAQDPFTTANTRRPLLILLDRDIDISVMLQHSWTYKSLVHDMFGIAGHQVTFTVIP